MIELIEGQQGASAVANEESASPVIFIARLEWLQARRQRLFSISTLMLLLLGLSVCLSFSGGASLLAEPMAALKSLGALWGLALPLLALMAAYKGIAAEREGATLGLLLSQPLTDAQLFVGKWLGGALPLLLACSCGALMTAMMYAALSDSVPQAFYWGLLRLWLGALALVLACHLSALAISAWCGSSQSALFIGLGWLGALLLLWDFVLLLSVLLGLMPPWLLGSLVNLSPVTLMRHFCDSGTLPIWALTLQGAAILALLRLGIAGIARREL